MRTIHLWLPRRRAKALVAAVVCGTVAAAFAALLSARLCAPATECTLQSRQRAVGAPVAQPSALPRGAQTPADQRTANSTHSGGCKPTAKAPRPPCVNDYTLRVQKKRIALPGAAEHGGPREIDVLTYNGNAVGPTIRVRRGTKLKVNVINELPEAQEPKFSGVPGQADPPHDLYTTNFHPHGLHVSPRGNSDNVFREIPPGANFQYTFELPADHPSGTFWYHPHKHGSLAYQLGNGMAGALIVEGRAEDAIHDLDEVPEIAAAKEQILVLQQMVLRVGPDGVGHVDPRDSYNPPAPDAYQVTAVNGEVMPTFTMQPGEVQRWRLVGAGREGSSMVCWYDDRDNRVNRWYFYEIAVDGLATGKLTARRSVTMIPGKRSDVLIKAPAQRGTYYLATMREDESPGGEEKFIVNYLAKVLVGGPEQPMPLPTPEQLAACRPFNSIDPAECKTKRNLVFSFDEQKKVFQINGLSFSEQTGLEKPLLGTAEEWVLTALDAPPGSPNEPHPFHLHVNPFEVVKIEKLSGKVSFPASGWHDTFPVAPGWRITVRIRFRDFAGKTVLHCHTLDHEDQGMMKTIEIVDPSRPDAVDDDLEPKLVERRQPAPPLVLPTAGGSTWDLQASARPTILVFIRGMSCVHCVRELRSLLQEARRLTGSGVQVAAVSSEPIEDQASALELLDVPASVDFRLLVDEARTAFRSFGCYDQRPLHGLFLIDRSAAIRASYAGELPFADAAQACASMRKILSENEAAARARLAGNANQ